MELVGSTVAAVGVGEVVDELTQSLWFAANCNPPPSGQAHVRPTDAVLNKHR